MHPKVRPCGPLYKQPHHSLRAMPPAPPHTGGLELPQPLPWKLPSFCAFKWLQFLTYIQTAWLPNTRPPQLLPPAFSLQSLLVSLPLFPAQVQGKGMSFRPPGCSEVGKKMELRKMEGVDGTWHLASLIHVLFPPTLPCSSSSPSAFPFVSFFPPSFPIFSTAILDGLHALK